MPSNCHTDCELPRCESCAGCTSDVGQLRERGSLLLCDACTAARLDALRIVNAPAPARLVEPTPNGASVVTVTLERMATAEEQAARYAAALQRAGDAITHETDGPCTPFVMIVRAIEAARRNAPALRPVPGPCSVTRIADPIAEALFAALGLRDDHEPSAHMTADGQG